MNDSEFDEKMIEIDSQLMKDGVPVAPRLILAWFYFTGEKELFVEDKDSRFGPYEGPNLCHSIWAWYVKYYPSQSTIGHDWGYRLILIRDQAFRVAIPVHFNPSNPLDAFENIEGLSDSLKRILTKDEIYRIQHTFNKHFWQSSNLAMVWTDWCAPPRFGLASDMIHRGWQDLKDACQSFNHRDPFSVLFTIQQGPEKFLKAMLLNHDSTLTERKLRDQFGHGIPKLLEACKGIEAGFSQFDAFAHLLDYGPDVRYRNKEKTQKEVVEIINYAYNICDFVSQHLIKK